MTAIQPSISSNPSTRALVTAIKEQAQDFEWYPTTEEILETIKEDMGEFLWDDCSILDCGAGDGRSLMTLTDGKRYAIEKSKPLIDAMDRSIFLVGTEFHQQTLIDKKVDMVFCNPPYSEFSGWMTKIISEANAGFAYFVVPTRWVNDTRVSDALKTRNAEAEIIGTFDFLSADRSARAVINIVRVTLKYVSRHHSSSSPPKVDPFDVWFDNNFSLNINENEASKHDYATKNRAGARTRVEQALVDGSDLVSALERFYQDDMEHLLNNYKSLHEIDPELLTEMNVSLSGIKGALKLKIEGLKDTYWKELFSHLTKITDRLTSRTRKQLLDKLTEHTHVDFSAINAYAVTSWALKNANVYYDEQLVAFVERMTAEANVKLYKSNERTFGKEDWKWCRTPTGLDRYFIDYRTVLSVGGISNSDWKHERERYNGLTESAYDFINDCLTIGNNLGFDTSESPRAGDFTWESKKQVDFFFKNHRTGKNLKFMDVRAYKNGNLHIRFNQAFMCKLNVEFGRLKGWLKDHREASEEIGISEELAYHCYGSNIKLEHSNVLRLDFKATKPN